MALGRTRHAAALPLLTGELQRADLDSDARAAAAVGLGETGQAEVVATLAAVAADRAADTDLRAACLSGMGAVPFEASLETLSGYLALENPESLRRAAIGGLALFGSSWAAEARGDTARMEVLRERAALALVGSLTATAALQELTIQAIQTVAHPGAKETLEAVIADARTSEAVRIRAQDALARLELTLSRRR